MTDDHFNRRKGSVDRAVAGSHSPLALSVLLQKDIGSRRDDIPAVDHIIDDLVCGRNLHGCARHDGVQFFGPYKMLLGDDAPECLIDLGVVFLTQIIAELAHHLDHFPDLVLFIQCDTHRVRERDIGKARDLLFLGHNDLLELGDHAVDLRDAHTGLDIEVGAAHLDKADHLLKSRIAVPDSRALHTGGAF